MDKIGWIKLIIWTAVCLLLIVFSIVYIIIGVAKGNAQTSALALLLQFPFGAK
jgi:hypothetical protein